MDTFKRYSFPDKSLDKDSYFMSAPAPKDPDILDDDYDDEFDILDDDYLEDDYEADDAGIIKDVNEGKLLLMVRNLYKEYRQGSDKLKILNNVNLRIYSGEITALIGPSGSGKSTLLHILGLLDSPTSGQILIGDEDVSKISDRARTKLRNTHIGFVYQFHHLLPEFSALENVALPLIIAGEKTSYAQDKAKDLLDQLGLAHRLKHRPAALSGGEQQRVAIARALVNDPYLLFADEPTGNLDPETAEEVFEILLNQVRSRSIGALIATHNMELANEMDRVLEMRQGRVEPY